MLQQYESLRAQVAEYHAAMDAAMRGQAPAAGGGERAAAVAGGEVAVRASRLR